MDSADMYYFACPSCSNNDRFYRVESDSGGSDGGILYFLFGGLLSPLFYAGAGPRMKVQCAHCGFVFNRPRPPTSGVATAVMVPLYLLAFAALVGLIAESSMPDAQSGTPDRLPGGGVIRALQSFVEAHSSGVAIALLVGIVLLVPVCFLTATIANWRQGRRIRATYEYEPTAFPPQPPPEERPPPTECPSCRYNLTGNTSGTCPECGGRISAPAADSAE